MQPKKADKILKARFRFLRFKVLESHFFFSDKDHTDFRISIEPTGEYYQKTKQFDLFLNMNFFSKKSDNYSIFIKCQSTFEFLEDLEENQIPKYFTVNAPAITFPYIRAYISALSALSGRKTITLATLNLVRMAKDLEENISFKK